MSKHGTNIKLYDIDGAEVLSRHDHTPVTSVSVDLRDRNNRTVLVNGTNVDEVQRADSEGLVLQIEVCFPLDQRPTLSIDGGPDELDNYLAIHGDGTGEVTTGGVIISGIHPDLCDCCCPLCHFGQHDCCEGYNYGESEKDLNCEGSNNVTVLIHFH